MPAWVRGGHSSTPRRHCIEILCGGSGQAVGHDICLQCGHAALTGPIQVKVEVPNALPHRRCPCECSTSSLSYADPSAVVLPKGAPHWRRFHLDDRHPVRTPGRGALVLLAPGEDPRLSSWLGVSWKPRWWQNQQGRPWAPGSGPRPRVIGSSRGGRQLQGWSGAPGVVGSFPCLLVALRWCCASWRGQDLPLLYLRRGAILPLYSTPPQSSAFSTPSDPMTLLVALDEEGEGPSAPIGQPASSGRVGRNLSVGAGPRRR